MLYHESGLRFNTQKNPINQEFRPSVTAEHPTDPSVRTGHHPKCWSGIKTRQGLGWNGTSPSRVLGCGCPVPKKKKQDDPIPQYLNPFYLIQT